MRTETYLVAPDGTRIDYTHDARFIPEGSLSVPLAVWQRALPGAAIASFRSGPTEVVSPNVYMHNGEIVLSCSEKGLDGVHREVDGSAVAFRWVVISDYSGRSAV